MMVAQGAWCVASAPLLREVDRAEFRMADIAFVAQFQRCERLAGRELGGRTFGGARMPRHAAEPERDDARRPELQKIPPTDPFVLAIATHYWPPWYRKAELVPLWLFQQG